jgi:hypothetical protein
VAARPELRGCGATDPWGNARAGFLATTEINRDDFDITWNQALETGGFILGKGVTVEIDVEAVRSASEIGIIDRVAHDPSRLARARRPARRSGRSARSSGLCALSDECLPRR